MKPLSRSEQHTLHPASAWNLVRAILRLKLIPVPTQVKLWKEPAASGTRREELGK